MLLTRPVRFAYSAAASSRTFCGAFGKFALVKMSVGPPLWMGSVAAPSIPKVMVGMLSLPTVWSHKLTWVQLPPKLSTCCPFSHDKVSLRFLVGEFRRDPAAYAETPDGAAKPLPELNAMLYPRRFAGVFGLRSTITPHLTNEFHAGLTGGTVVFDPQADSPGSYAQSGRRRRCCRARCPSPDRRE